MRVLVTGAAGFIGMHTSSLLLARGDEVIGVDNLNDYYDVSLKEARLARLRAHANFTFHHADVADAAAIQRIFSEQKPDRVVHLAAQAGVRYSLTHPHAYIEANIQGFLNILEACRAQGTEHLVYASSSSVYGGNVALPFSEHQNIDHPVSLYAATKKANELMAHTYSHLFGIPTTGLRFFTVYGPWGRPDMALFLFAKAILENRPIDVFNNGQMTRDFTYVADIVESVVRLVDKPATPDPDFDPAHPDPATSNAPYRVFNIGNSRPTPLMGYIAALERSLGAKAQMNMLPMQPGDVQATAADTSALEAWIGFKPDTSIETGISRFVDWYMEFYGVNRAALPA
ncbi:NAD-dependent epimerase [Sphingomonas yunnanensis]|uniref:NAD-dependent epimerase n=1 Tax=Sphingomonas yunnanensis TaxID=310400 RepID=UPI001CA6339D|nr:NAD-dependent epimerase [Sphingomonas yunnanensis]MBY9063458.1 NAD-dependent epimerase [Sphingomonas yunnanensis]